jgi:hypothetical protein
VRFEVATPNRMVFGEGVVAGLPGIVRDLVGRPAAGDAHGA